MRRKSSRWAAHLLALVCTTGACLTLDGFIFTNEKVDAYGWDDDPCDPQLQGELSENEELLNDGPPASCHPSLIDLAHRSEGMLELADREVHWMYARADGATTTIFYSHGRSKHLGRYWDRVELLWSLGFNVLTYDYPQYGRSTGSVLDEHTMDENAEAMLEMLDTLEGVDPERVFYYGYSLGSAPTTSMALRAFERDDLPRPLGIVLESPFCSVEALVQDGSFLDFPGGFFADNELDNCARIGKIDESVELMILHGAQDEPDGHFASNGSRARTTPRSRRSPKPPTHPGSASSPPTERMP
jgi:pimeloyl-ACP methyl ester carboxylesterase